MEEQFRLNINARDGIGIERSTDGKDWSQDIYINTGEVGSTAKLAVKLIYLLNDLNDLIESQCPEVIDCPYDLINDIPKNKCPICWDIFFNKKVDELGK